MKSTHRHTSYFVSIPVSLWCVYALLFCASPLLGQQLDYLEIANPESGTTSLQQFEKQLLLSQATQNKQYYTFHQLSTSFVQGPSKKISFKIPISNTTGLIKMARLSDGSIVVMGRRPGGETFISRWDAGYTPQWVFRLKSGDSPDLPQRNLLIYGTDTIIVVDIVHVNTTTKRLLITLISKEGKLIYSHSVFRKNIDWTRMNAYCDGRQIWFCAQPKLDTSAIIRWDVIRQQFVDKIDILGMDIDNIKRLPDQSLIIAGRDNTDQAPIIAKVDPKNLRIIKAFKILTLDPIVEPEIQLEYDDQSIYLDIQGKTDSFSHIIRFNTVLDELSSFTLKTVSLSKPVVLRNSFYKLCNFTGGLQPVLARYNPDNPDKHCEVQDFCFDLIPTQINILPGGKYTLFPGSVLRKLDITVSEASMRYRDTCLSIKKQPSAAFSIPSNILCLQNCIAPSPFNNSTAESWEWKISGALDSIWSREQNPGCFRFTKAGKYTMTQTIKFFGCLYSSSKELVVSDEFLDFDIPDLYLCPGLDTTLILPMGINNIQWDDGTTDKQRTFDHSGTFFFVGTNPAGCPLTDTFQVYEISPPMVQILPRDTTVCEEEPFTLQVIPQKGTSYLWSNGDSTHYAIIHEAGVYEVTATNTCGMDVDEVRIDLKPCKVRTYIPNVFTPNGDGINDVFEVFLNNAVFLSLQLFDRWGNQVFTQSSGDEPWKGTFNHEDCPSGVYIYVLHYRDDFTGQVHLLKGSITLIR